MLLSLSFPPRYMSLKTPSRASIRTRHELTPRERIPYEEKAAEHQRYNADLRERFGVTFSPQAFAGCVATTAKRNATMAFGANEPMMMAKPQPPTPLRSAAAAPFLARTPPYSSPSSAAPVAPLVVRAPRYSSSSPAPAAINTGRLAAFLSMPNDELRSLYESAMTQAMPPSCGNASDSEDESLFFDV